ncbi:hypothetical protein DO021_06215 [Desulfobacter hydrogenophilus]|uniref:Mu-like prophage protein Com n=1 Tax=Desulfobacter hydrogenophilus TaxID=2291 RepID=A0A328FI35_9BACT|nr:hypothetical protein EYB58_15845 [Desulfobacter hydrogenophilus]RAM02813.1 hypothetical protein DO021_06215 [Desulfobacter hydrogenophilus]
MDQNKIEAIQGNSKFKSYLCPYCQKFLMKGDVRRLKMTCPHCQRLIDADEDELLSINNSDEKQIR